MMDLGPPEVADGTLVRSLTYFLVQVFENLEPCTPFL